MEGQPEPEPEPVALPDYVWEMVVMNVRPMRELCK